MILNQTADVRYGGTGGKSQEPNQNPSDYPTYPEIDLAPFNLRGQTMKLEAMSKWYQHWRDISRYVNPKRGFFEGFVPDYNAQIDHRLIIDGHPRRAARTLAAGMLSGISSPSRPWFKLGLQDAQLEKRPNVKWWLERVQETLMTIFARSNVYGALQQHYEELGLFGTGDFGLFEDYHTVVRARSYTIGEYCLANDHNGRVNTFFRMQLWMTADQIVNEFGWTNCSDLVKNAYKAGQRDSFFQLYQLCEPNTTKIEGRYDFKGKKWRQVTWEAASVHDRALRIGGFDEFPHVATRWQLTTTADVYGTGPGFDAIGDVKSLYRLKKDMLLGLNKQVDPPVQIDATVEGQASMLPGGITRKSVTTPDGGVRPAYQVEINLKNALEVLQQFRNDISEDFHADLFASMLTLDRSNMTAAEVAARHEEKLLLLGPVLERIESECHDPLIDRAFAIANRAGLLPPPPPEIQGMPLEVTYISLLAQAQQMVRSASMERVASFVNNLGTANPGVFAKLNTDEMVDEYADAVGAPSRILRTNDEAQAIRDQEAKEKQAASMAQNMGAVAMAAKNLASAPVGDRSALEHLTGAEPTPGVGA